MPATISARLSKRPAFADSPNNTMPTKAVPTAPTPIQAMKDWYASHPDLFNKRPYDHTGCDRRERPGGDVAEIAGTCIAATMVYRAGCVGR
jgi:hypothetical protein